MSAHTAWQSLSYPERLRLPVVAASLMAIESSLRMLGVKRTSAWLQRFCPPSDRRTPTHAEARRLAMHARRVGTRCPIPARCLAQALYVQTWLRRRGCEGVVQYGARIDDHGALRAHAWVEFDDECLDPYDQTEPHATFGPRHSTEH